MRGDPAGLTTLTTLTTLTSGTERLGHFGRSWVRRRGLADDGHVAASGRGPLGGEVGNLSDHFSDQTGQT
jgi:hypothetical protein